jgi:hypothetical protein
MERRRERWIGGPILHPAIVKVGQARSTRTATSRSSGPKHTLEPRSVCLLGGIALRRAMAAKRVPECQLLEANEILRFRFVELHPNRTQVGGLEEAHFLHPLAGLVGEILVRRQPILQRVASDQNAAGAVSAWGNSGLAVAASLKPVPRYGPRHHNREIVTVRRQKHSSIAPCASVRH